MKRIFFDSRGGLRNGWWMLVFVAFFLVSRFVYHPISQAIQHAGLDKAWLQPLPFIFALLVTWCCTRLRQQPLGSVGFVLDRRWAMESALGASIGIAEMLIITGLIYVAGGVHLTLDPARSLGALGSAAWVFLFVALFEETLFRGFLFQRFVEGAGAWPAMLGLGLVFAIAHWGNPDMTGATKVWATIDTGLGGIVLGLGYLRTRSLAFPIGFHFAWNWTQGALLGFDVSGFDQAGWLQPLLLNKPEWVTGGSFGPEASVFAVIVDLTLIGLLWKWKGTGAGRSARPEVAGELAP
ncbi:MAG: type II CAAX endopeptidase family protein [Dokdonella sp.]